MFAQHSLKLGFSINIDTAVLVSVRGTGRIAIAANTAHPQGREQRLQRCRFSIQARSYQLTNVFTAQYRRRMNFFYVG
jgi:hypothetical protein